MNLTADRAGAILGRMRPYYCKPSDNKNEQEVLGALVSRLNRDSIKFNQGRTYSAKLTGSQQHAHYDGELFVNGKLFALVEIKCRKGSSERYADWHMAQHKIQRNRAAAAAKGVPLFLVYRWDDGVFMADASKLDLSRTHIGGRTDRNDPYDQEVMVLMNSKSFNRV